MTVWAYLPRYNPITQWILDTYAGVNKGLYYTLIFANDIIVNLLLALPVAYIITRIRPDRRWLYVAAIVLAMFVWDYRIVLFERRDFFDFISSSALALVGLALYVSYLPFTLFCITKLSNPESADESVD